MLKLVYKALCKARVQSPCEKLVYSCEKASTILLDRGGRAIKRKLVGKARVKSSCEKLVCKARVLSSFTKKRACLKS